MTRWMAVARDARGHARAPADTLVELGGVEVAIVSRVLERARELGRELHAEKPRFVAGEPLAEHAQGRTQETGGRLPLRDTSADDGVEECGPVERRRKSRAMS